MEFNKDTPENDLVTDELLFGDQQPDLSQQQAPISEAERMINAHVTMMHQFGIDTFAPRNDTPGGCGDRREF